MRSFQLDVRGVLVGVSLFILACGEGGVSGSPSAGAGGQSGSGNNSGGQGGTAGGGAGSGGASGSGASGASGSAGTANAAGTAGASGMGGSAGGSSDPCANTLVCDDFEDYAVGMDPGGSWVLDENNGAVEVDDMRAVSGTKSVRFDTNAGQYKSALIAIDGAPFPVAGNAFWGRMMFYITQAANDGVHWTMIAGEGPDAAHDNDLASVRYGGQHQKRLMANYWSEPNTSDCWHHSQTVIPEGRWACMEWFFDGPNETMQFYLDGAEVEDLELVAVSDTGNGDGCNPNATDNHWYFPTFERVAVGWQSYQSDDARELWIDDVALALDRVGCPE